MKHVGFPEATYACGMFVTRFGVEAMRIYELRGMAMGYFEEPDCVFTRLGAVVARLLSEGCEATEEVVLREALEPQPPRYVALIEWSLGNYGIYIDRQAAMRPYDGGPEALQAKIDDIATVDAHEQWQFLDYVFQRAAIYRRWAGEYHAIMVEPMSLADIDSRDCDAV